MKGNQILIGLGLGAGLMYVLDPDRGKRRRTQARDKVIHALNVADSAIGKASRDFNNRLKGLEAEMKSIFRRERVDDDVLNARVRTRIG